jgi:alpha-aminoadipate carrier protein LysW
MTTTNCIECGGEIAFAREILLGEIAPCPDCGVALEVLGASPLELAVAPEVEEDWGE